MPIHKLQESYPVYNQIAPGFLKANLGCKSQNLKFSNYIPVIEICFKMFVILIQENHITCNSPNSFFK